jgi:hypothetical protein
MATRTFDSVWFLSGENRWRDMNLLAFRDAGRLVVGEDSLQFHGKREKVVITSVKGISYGKQGRDFVNNWVRIEYGDAPATSIAFFADGSLLGWGGVFGGTKRLLAAIQHLAR